MVLMQWRLASRLRTRVGLSFTRSSRRKTCFTHDTIEVFVVFIVAADIPSYSLARSVDMD